MLFLFAKNSGKLLRMQCTIGFRVCYSIFCYEASYGSDMIPAKASVICSFFYFRRFSHPFYHISGSLRRAALLHRSVFGSVLRQIAHTGVGNMSAV